MTWRGWLLIVSALATVAAVWRFRVLRLRIRAKDRELQDLRRREAERAAFCAGYGHHLDERCRCTRCLVEQHAYSVLAVERTEIRNELVNPRADPGALHLDSNFQPDHDYGRTQTVFRVGRTHRCERCGHTMQTVEEETVADEP